MPNIEVNVVILPEYIPVKDLILYLVRHDNCFNKQDRQFFKAADLVYSMIFNFDLCINYRCIHQYPRRYLPICFYIH